MSNQEKKELLDVFKKGPWKTLVFLFLIILVFGLFKPWVQVGAGERGIVMNFGAVQDKVLNEGIHFRVPVMQEVVLMDIKIHKVVTDAASASSDLQDVALSVALNYHILPEKANLVYQTIGVEFKERMIDPAIQEVMKAVSARYTAEELITKRPAVSAEMQESLTKRLLLSNISVDAFSIVSFSFSKIFTDAIEAKQTAEQNALKAKRDLDRIRVEAEQTIAAATAEAEALRLQK
jgi:regulator of protease activity HflC (stomatin/prohibitin superfamily)